MTRGGDDERWIGAARVRLTIRPDPDTWRPCTTVTSPFVLGAGPCFELSSPHLARVFRLSAGWRVFTLDTPHLDARFERIGDDPRAIRRAFTPEVLTRLAHLPAIRIHSDGARLELYHPYRFADASVSRLVVEVVGLLAQVDAAPALASLRALPDVVFHEPIGNVDSYRPATAELPALGAQIVFLGERGRRITRVMRPCAGRPLNGVHSIDASGRPQATSRLPAGVLARLPALGAALLRSQDGWATVTFDGIVTDEARLLAAAAVCRALATAATESVYR